MVAIRISFREYLNFLYKKIDIKTWGLKEEKAKRDGLRAVLKLRDDCL